MLHSRETMWPWQLSQRELFRLRVGERAAGLSSSLSRSNGCEREMGCG